MIRSIDWHSSAASISEVSDSRQRGQLTDLEALPEPEEDTDDVGDKQDTADV